MNVLPPDWVFLTELLVIPGIWLLVCAWNNQFADEKYFERIAHDRVLLKYQGEK